MIFISTDMQSRGRGLTPYRGGRNNSSYRGGRSYESKDLIAQHGSKKLIASNISELSTASNTELEEFKKWKEIQKGNTPGPSNLPSFARIVEKNKQQEDNMVQNIEERVILLLKDSDKKWIDNPWIIQDRYLGHYGYTMETYKSRKFYENILSTNGCEITHFSGADKEVYNFSKIIIYEIISLEDWGISPFNEKKLMGKTTINYNYWDYITAFDKCFFYENNRKSHTWFFKIMPEVYNSSLPSWFILWWNFYGTKEDILPEIFIEFFNHWKNVKPSDPTTNNIPDNMRFFIEFSIPWIWRHCPVTGYSQGFFCLKRQSFTKFWDTMMREDPKTKQLNCIITINEIKEKLEGYDRKAKEIENNRYNTDSEDDIDFEASSEAEIVQQYMGKLKKILKQRREQDKFSNKSDTSMASGSHNNFDILQHTQDLEEDPNEDVEKITSQALAAFLDNRPT